MAQIPNAIIEPKVFLNIFSLSTGNVLMISSTPQRR
jgi:hypothetical protein